jgi:hypothetical protein
LEFRTSTFTTPTAISSPSSDDADGRTSRVQINVTAGRTYYIKAAAYSTSTGVYQLQISMPIDTDDIRTMEANNTVVTMLTHEIGHVLDFGTIWDSLGRVRNASRRLRNSRAPMPWPSITASLARRRLRCRSKATVRSATALAASTGILKLHNDAPINRATKVAGRTRFGGDASSPRREVLRFRSLAES